MEKILVVCLAKFLPQKLFNQTDSTLPDISFFLLVKSYYVIWYLEFKSSVKGHCDQVPISVNKAGERCRKAFVISCLLKQMFISVIEIDKISSLYA